LPKRLFGRPSSVRPQKKGFSAKDWGLPELGLPIYLYFVLLGNTLVRRRTQPEARRWRSAS
jgi:hypothetical protein